MIISSDFSAKLPNAVLTCAFLQRVRPRTCALRMAGRAQYEALLSAGVRIYEWQPTVMHAKTFVVDGLWSTVGSMNFDNRSLALNDESTLMILDADTGAQMNAIFFDDLRIRLRSHRRVFAGVHGRIT